jgi:hypothetical protein
MDCLKPIHGFNHPTPQIIQPPIRPKQTTSTKHKTQIIFWNVASLNTTLLITIKNFSFTRPLLQFPWS